MPVKSFGPAPTDKIAVRIQHIVAGRPIKTESFHIYGQEFDDARQILERCMEQEFGSRSEEEESEDTAQEPPPPPATARKAAPAVRKRVRS